MGGPLPRDDRGPSGAEPGRAGVGARAAARVAAGAAGGLRRGARRPRPGRGPGRDALAAPGVARLLPDRCVRPVGAGRPRVVGARRAGDALVDVAGVHRARDARPRLDGRAARAARPLPLRRRRRRRDRGVGVRRHAVRAAGGALAGRRRRTVRSPAGVHLDAGPQLDREGGAHRRAAARPAPAGRRRRRASRCGPTRWRPRWPRTAPPASRRSSWSPTSAPRRRPPSIRCPPIADAVRGARRVAPRRRRPRRVRAGVPGAAVDRRRRRAGRQLLHEPAQVAVHQLRLRLLLGGRPHGAHRRAQRPARVPAQRGQRVGRGHRLPRLAGAARPALPVA